MKTQEVYNAIIEELKKDKFFISFFKAYYLLQKQLEIIKDQNLKQELILKFVLRYVPLETSQAVQIIKLLKNPNNE